MFPHKPLARPVLLIALLMLCSLCLSGCRNGTEPEFSPDIITTDSAIQTPIISDQSQHKPTFELGLLEYDEPASYDIRDGYDTLVRTENASYLYASETDVDIVESIRETEILIAVAQELDIRPAAELWFCFAHEEQPVKTEFWRWQSRWRANIYPEDSSNQGIIIYLLTGGRLPAWLCAGLELCILEEYDLADSSITGFSRYDASRWHEKAARKGLPLFGDEWFVPGMIKDELSVNIHSIAGAFVSYISETGQLQNLVLLYMDDTTIQAAETMKKDLWREFVENDIEMPGTDELFFVQYLYNQNKISDYRLQSLQSVLVGHHMFSILAQHSRLYFGTEEWTLEDARLFVYATERGIFFIKDWFDFERGNRFEVILQSPFPAVGYLGVCVGNGIIVIGIDNVVLQYGYISTLAHEVTHAAADLFGIETNLPDARFRSSTGSVARNHFAEGLARMLQYIYLLDYPDPELSAYYSAQASQLVNDHFGKDAMDVYDRFARTVGYDPARIDAAAFLDIDALVTLKYFDFDFEELIAPESKDAVLYRFLRTPVVYDDQSQYGTHYTLFPSFIMYLFEQSNSKDDFIRAYTDISLMEEVYGKDILGMLYEWYERFVDFL